MIYRRKHGSYEKANCLHCEIGISICLIVCVHLYSHFIQVLASFQKPLVANVQGRTVGVGVTILPLFDMVFAQRDATFETPYVSVGQIPEGCSVFAISNKLNQNIVSTSRAWKGSEKLYFFN